MPGPSRYWCKWDRTFYQDPNDKIKNSHRPSWGPSTVQQAWPELPLPQEIERLQPDGLVRLEVRKQVFVVEVVRTMDHGLNFDFNRAAEKLNKYEPLRVALLQALPGTLKPSSPLAPCVSFGQYGRASLLVLQPTLHFCSEAKGGSITVTPQSSLAYDMAPLWPGPIASSKLPSGVG